MSVFRKLLLRSALAIGVFVGAAAAWDIATYDRDAWLDDYARLKRDMAQGYANLDWMAERRGVDLVALDRRTTDALSNAHSRVRAFFALRDFVGAFGDPHLRLQPGDRSAASTPIASDTQAPADPPAGHDCASSGYEEGDHAFRFPFASMPGWQGVADGDFPAGLVGDVGVLRIAQLGENRYLAACNAVHRAGIGQRALQLAVRAKQQQALRAAIETLRERGAKRLMIDLTGNGGGSEWSNEVVALLTDRTFVRSEARVVDAQCDRSGVWRGETPACDVFGDKSPATATLEGIGAWRGPVLMLVDAGTASASEEVVAWLRDNHAAKVIGTPTMGAGCGYIDGGKPTRLSQIPFDVHMPNCARFLADGTNEVEGIAPDLPLPAEEAMRAAALARALGLRSR